MTRCLCCSQLIAGGSDSYHIYELLPPPAPFPSPPASDISSFPWCRCNSSVQMVGDTSTGDTNSLQHSRSPRPGFPFLSRPQGYSMTYIGATDVPASGTVRLLFTVSATTTNTFPLAKIVFPITWAGYQGRVQNVTLGQTELSASYDRYSNGQTFKVWPPSNEHGLKSVFLSALRQTAIGIFTGDSVLPHPAGSDLWRTRHLAQL